MVAWRPSDAAVRKLRALMREPEGAARVRARAWLAVVVLLGLTIMFSLDLVPARFLGVRPGQPSSRTIVAPAAVEIVDVAATEELRRRAVAAVGTQYAFDPRALDGAVAATDRFFARAADMTHREGLTSAQRLAELRRASPDGVTDQVLRAALSLPAGELDRISLETRQLVSALLVGRVTRDDLERVRGAFSAVVAGLDLPVAERRIIEGVGQAVLAPTYVENPELMRELTLEASQSVRPVVLRRQRNEVIVRQGEVVSREHVLLMGALGLTRSRLDVRRVAGAGLVVALMTAAVLAFLKRADPGAFDSTKDLLILGILMFVVAIAGKGMTTLGPDLPVAAVPVATAAMVSTLLIDPVTGAVAAAAAAVVLAGATDFTAEVLVSALIAGTAAVFAASRVSRRSGLYRAGAIVMASSALAAGGVSLFSGSSAREAAVMTGFGFLGGLISTVLAVGSLPLFETVFKITTDLRLADLMNPNQPLLHELMLRAPGTYNHSSTVANLAEAAAEAVGANALLARAGAYYHDIGKAKRPNFFAENQIGGMVNPHDTTNPRLSSLVITAHVKEGVELAEAERLPDEVIDIIKQHHGTSVVSYFYQRAVEEQGYQAVNEDDFRYESDKPKSREAAIVMLADGVEALVRTLAKPTPQRIEQAARKIVQQRLDDGQLDESRLTVCDLDLVVKAFTNVLAGMYHPRVDYPEGTVIPHRRRVAPDGSGGQGA